MQQHVGFFRCAAAFVNIATDTSRYDVFPTITAASGTRNHMVKGEIVSGVTAVLTGVTITVEDISAGERNFFVRNPDIVAQSDHGWEWKSQIHKFAVVFNLLCFSFDQQYDRSPPASDVERFVGGV